MNPSRALLFTMIVVATLFQCAYAQRRYERLPPPRDPQFYEPRNKLEDFDGRIETLLIKGRHWIGTLRTQNGSARIEAYEVRDSQKSERATGVLITISTAEHNDPNNEIRSLIDYEEIEALLKTAIPTGTGPIVPKADDSVTKLSHFEERYRTRGDFEAIVFKQLNGTAVSVAIEGGFFDRVRLFMSLDDLTKLRWMISQAKDKLDEVK